MSNLDWALLFLQCCVTIYKIKNLNVYRRAIDLLQEKFFDESARLYKLESKISDLQQENEGLHKKNTDLATRLRALEILIANQQNGSPQHCKDKNEDAEKRLSTSFFENVTP